MSRVTIYYDVDIALMTLRAFRQMLQWRSRGSENLENRIAKLD